MSPLVSIIINNYNYGRFVRQAIESALAQTYENVEVIIVDDGSTDDSREVIGEYADRTTVICKSNGGQASAFNVGIARAKGEYALLLDSDDYLFPDAIATCVQAFPAGYSRLYFRLAFLGESGQALLVETSASRFDLLDGDVFANAKDGAPIFLGPPTSGNFFDALVLKQITPIPEQEYRICADAFVLARTSLLGPVKALNQQLGAYRIHDDNAFFSYAALFSSPRRLNSQICNYFASTGLMIEATREAGRDWRPEPVHRDFWLLHLFCAGLVWDVGNLAKHGYSRHSLRPVIGQYLFKGKDHGSRRVTRMVYLLVLVMLPKAAARRVLRWVDERMFRRPRAQTDPQWRPPVASGRAATK